MSAYTETVIETVKSDSRSTAPNGSITSHDFYTTVVKLQTWTEGPYQGHTYKITERYLSSSPNLRGQIIDTSSTFYSAP